MTLAIDRNDPAIRRHAESYRREMGAKRRQALLGAVIFIACVVLAAIGSEVDPGKFAENAWRFPKYILETMPVLRWNSLGADVAEWYWGLKGWLKLLWQTRADRLCRHDPRRDRRLPLVLRRRRQSRQAAGCASLPAASSNSAAPSPRSSSR